MCLDIYKEVNEPTARGMGYKVFVRMQDGTLESPLQHTRWHKTWKKSQCLEGRYSIHVYLTRKGAEKALAWEYFYSAPMSQLAIRKVEWQGLRAVGIDGSKGLHTDEPVITVAMARVLEEGE